MNRFDWQARLKEVYDGFPEAGCKPVIGITANYGEENCKLAEGYYKSVIAAGGVPVVIPPSENTDVIINTLEHIDGLLLSGGADYNPLYCGEEPVSTLGSINDERDMPELLLTRLAYNRQIPMLGICRGIQTLAMALGGKVLQDIAMLHDDKTACSADNTTVIKHSQDARRHVPTHTVNIAADSILHSLYNAERIAVNSFHHQAVSDTGKRFRVTARAADGVIEAMESSEYRSAIGVQWHPECLAEGAPLFEWLVKEAASFRAANRLHDRIITLDTHCDTPMFFPQGVRFDRRDDRLLVDLQKMNEGRQDATIMVAYLPQPAPGETFASKVAFDVNGPRDYADLIFTKIDDIVKRNASHLALARTPDELVENKRNNRKSIMLGIENALALEGDVANVERFARRGVVYFTLCHNGDNDICDSARGSATHNGVSKLGEQVIKEMNRCGVMVDLSHASEKSFYDALDISSTPIVCSHSSCRNLCDHPRNLTDDQMKALAAKGGVMQITLYHGFLRSGAEATVIDALEHLRHAIGVMGIGHVGIGTDFDGDGGVRGFADASEVLSFTRRLMSLRYSEDDIRRIWGGNFLRVMSLVQQYK
ncbi:MAG: membrane dipeptidase [Prevotella sp.]